MHRPDPLNGRLLLTLTLVVLLPMSACALDEAELFRAGAPQISAEVGQLRVLSYDDDPGDDWIDIVTPDAMLFEEGDAFREADSRTASDDQSAEQRRLFTGRAPGRTLLVQLNEVDDELLVWDLVVGDPDQPFSDGTHTVHAGRQIQIDVGGYVVVALDASGGPATEVVSAAPDGASLALVASHEPSAGAPVWVDVYRAVDPGSFTFAYRDVGGLVQVPIAIG